MSIRLFIIGILLSSTSFAQTNLFGTWVLKNREHVLGPDYENALPKQITLQQREDSLIVESLFVEDGQDVSSRQAVAVDGKPVAKTGTKSNRKYIRSLKWNDDKKGFVFTTVIYLPNNPNEVDLTRIETFTLSADGKQLNLYKKSVETRSENWESKGVYVRKFVEE